jgi:hypothetical protein
MGQQPESKLSRQIMSALRARGIWCFKVHGGPFTMAGVPDIIACVPILIKDYDTDTECFVGTFVGFETKMPSGGDPSPIQAHVHRRISEAYGTVFVPRSVEDAVDALNWLGWCRPDDGPRSMDKPSLWTGVKRPTRKRSRPVASKRFHHH